MPTGRDAFMAICIQALPQAALHLQFCFSYFDILCTRGTLGLYRATSRAKYLDCLLAMQLFLQVQQLIHKPSIGTSTWPVLCDKL